MPSDLSFTLLHRRTVARADDGAITIRLGLVPRLLRTFVGAVAIGIIALAFLPVSFAIAITVAGLVATFWWVGRPSAVLDIHERVLVIPSTWIPFLRLATHRIPLDTLDRFHTIERRDEEAQTTSSMELLLGPRLVIRHEVYTRVQGKPVVVGDFRSKTEAAELVAMLNREIGARVH